MKVKNVGKRPITIFGVDLKPGEIGEVKASKEEILKTGLKVEILKSERRRKKKSDEGQISREMKQDIKPEGEE